jgi:polyphosphate kinase
VRESGGDGTSSQEALYHYFSTRKVSLDEPEPAASESTEPAVPKNRFIEWLKKLFCI